jgi:glucose/arabinose dehydrogenase
MNHHMYRTYTTTVTVLVAVIIILTACSLHMDRSSTDRPTGQVQTRIIATGLQAPWGLAFLPDGRALVSERDSGRLVSIYPSGTVREVQRLPADGTGEGGLLGITLSPGYATDGLVYAYYSTAQDNRVVRFRSNRDDAQNLRSLSGKILRIMSDGRMPADNPFPNNPVYSYGHRNVQGLAWDARGQLYATEFGQNSFDEVNRIVPGGNYGWPEVEGNGGDNRSIRPVTTFRVGEASPSGAAILRDGAIPQWEGNLFVAGLRGERLWRLVLGSDGSVTQRETLLQGEYGRLRHVAQAPDGSLWVLTSNRDGRGNPASDDDRILRIAPAGG